MTLRKRKQDNGFELDETKCKSEQRLKENIVQSQSYRYTNADLKASPYVRVHIIIIP